jgi:hypothetical protein
MYFFQTRFVSCVYCNYQLMRCGTRQSVAAHRHKCCCIHGFFSPRFFLCAVISALVPNTCYIMMSENGSCIALQSKRTCANDEQSVACLDRSGLHKLPKPSASEESASDEDESASAPELEDFDCDSLFPLDGPSLFLEVYLIRLQLRILCN